MRSNATPGAGEQASSSVCSFATSRGPSRSARRRLDRGSEPAIRSEALTLTGLPARQGLGEWPESIQQKLGRGPLSQLRF